ncbi:MAG: hypothetical protein M9941_19815 [Anaerolineae bacterium]|nr:hypothetical protein [Anaerolineae bacterium]MCO5195453.1 hypothetical protein [Anaerolineae bacterium]MCO5199989.1 hypothetical protein [Anaerolineae bacterium]
MSKTVIPNAPEQFRIDYLRVFVTLYRFRRLSFSDLMKMHNYSKFQVDAALSWLRGFGYVDNSGSVWYVTDFALIQMGDG